MIAKTLRMNRGDLQIRNGLNVKKTMDVGTRKEAKTVPTTSRVNPSLASARVMLDRIDAPAGTSSTS